MPDKPIFLGVRPQTNDLVYMMPDSRTLSTYVVGKTGMGKSNMLLHIAFQDIQGGDGVCVMDPHGDLVEDILTRIPYERRQDVIILDPGDPQYAFGLNPFFCPDPQFIDQRADAFVDALASLAEFAEVFKVGTRMRDILHQLAITFIVNKGTLAETPYFFYNKDFRQKMYPALERQYHGVAEFWRQFDKLPARDRRELTESSLNKLRRFQIHRMMRGIFGQAETTVDFHQAMEENKIILVKLNQAMIGPENAALLGAYLMYELYQACYKRSLKPVAERRQFHIIADEFHQYMTKVFPLLQQGSRKYGIDTVVAHQTRAQLDYQTKASTKNVGNLIIFSIIGDDAQDLVTEYNVTVPDELITHERQVTEPHLRPLSATTGGEAGKLIQEINRALVAEQVTDEKLRDERRLADERTRQLTQAEREAAQNERHIEQLHAQNSGDFYAPHPVLVPTSAVTANPFLASATPATIADYNRQLINEYLYARMIGFDRDLPDLYRVLPEIKDRILELGNILAYQPVLAPSGHFETVVTGVNQGRTSEEQARAAQAMVQQNQYAAFVRTKEGRYWRYYTIDTLPPPIPFADKFAAKRQELEKSLRPTLSTKEGKAPKREKVIHPVDDPLATLEADTTVNPAIISAWSLLRMQLQDYAKLYKNDWPLLKDEYPHYTPENRMKTLRSHINAYIKALLCNTQEKASEESLFAALVKHQVTSSESGVYFYHSDSSWGIQEDFHEVFGSLKTIVEHHMKGNGRYSSVREEYTGETTVYLTEYPTIDPEALLKLGAGLVEHIRDLSLTRYYRERDEIDRQILKRVNPAGIIGDDPPVQGTLDGTDYETR